MTLQLHVKISTRYSELKFHLGLLNQNEISTRDENFKFSM